MGRFLADEFRPPRPTRFTWFKALTVLVLILIVERTAFFYRYLTHGSHRKAIVVASIQKEDSAWLRRFFDKDWEVHIYAADSTEADLTVFKNAGHEASVYLTYIINHYWDLPEYMVFSHAQRYQWHNDDPMFDGVQPIKNLRLEHVKKEGYVNLRCDQRSGCPVAVRPNATAADSSFAFEKAFANAFTELFPRDGPVPDVVGHQCCGQFAVTRAQVHKRRPTEYERLRQWIWTTEELEFQAGRVFEHAWHMVFSKPAVHCPSAPECYCRQYGLCDLKCPEAPESCLGRFHITPFWVEMDKAWPRKGQGKNGFPRNRWWEEYYPKDLYDGFKLRPGAELPEDAYRYDHGARKPKPKTPATPSDEESSMDTFSHDNQTAVDLAEGGSSTKDSLDKAKVPVHFLGED